MQRFLFATLVIWALFLSGATCAPRTNQGPRNERPLANQPTPASKENQPVARSITLTHEHVSDFLAIDLNAIPYDAQALQVPVTKVQNPGATQLSIFVYLSIPKDANGKEQRKLIGSFSLYPADRGGKFVIGAGDAVRLLKGKGAAPNNPRLLFELQRIHADKPWTPVELTIEEPQWLTVDV